MMTQPIPSLALGSLRDAYASGAFSPRSLIPRLRQQALEQAGYNAWITLLDESQLEPYLARLDAVPPGALPLYGVPFAIKDNIDLAGVPTTAACEAFAYVAEQSAPVVQALLAAGAVPLGKTNMDQFATGLVGTRSPYGEAKNAFNQDYMAGGSSSGSALATALGQVSFALGTDTAGSGRVPAVLNNLIGHKPSRGLVSTRGVVPACRSLDCVSFFALCCDDIAALLEIAVAYDPRDAFSRPNHFANRRRYYRGEESGAGFRFAVPAAPDFGGDAQTRALFERGVQQLCALGGSAVAIDFTPFLEAARLLYDGPWVSERWLATRGVPRQAMLPVIADIIGGGERRTAAEAFAASYRLADLKRQCDGLLAGVDFGLVPTTPTIFTRAQLAEQPIARNSLLGTYTNFLNLLDYCATAVPVGLTAGGVPWGVSLFGPALADVRVLGFARRLQRACGLPLGATGRALPEDAPGTAPAPPADAIDVVVCGAHLEGQPLNWQLTERGGSLRQKTRSAACYKLYALPDGKRPAMVRDETGGRAIEIEVWSLPAATFGSFVAGIPAPLGIGQVELQDGSWRCGFICDAYALTDARDISGFGGWRAWLAHRAAAGANPSP